MHKNRTTRMMSIILMIAFIVIFLILSGRFFYIQATGDVKRIPYMRATGDVEYLSLEEWAETKRTNEYTLTAKRGTIYDRNGMPLAQDRVTYRVQAVVDETYTTDEESPNHVVNPNRTAELLAPLIEMEEAEVRNILLEGIEEERFQVEFGFNGRDLSQETKEEIESLELPGIIFQEEAKRYYPNGEFASHIIGFARKEDGGITKGVTGIEQQFNDVLTGVDGHISYQRDRYNTKLLEPNEIIQEPQDGRDIYLTIDQKIQTFLEDAMTQVVDQYDPERITAVVMEPETGEILALSNRPSYNPNQIGEVSNWYNDVISTPFEPGSTFKIFTLAAAIEEGVYNPDEEFQSGTYINEYMNSPIADHNYGKGWGKITYEEGIQRSSNVAVAKLVWDKIGTQTFLEYLQAFNFDQPTGIDLPGEQSGYILYNRPIEQITSSFGQGLTVTPIQQMMAATAVANDGAMMRPFVLSKIVESNSNKTVEQNEPEVAGNPISEETAIKVRDTLETVITAEHGTGHNVYNLNDYSVAGKTGTAQIPDPENPGYLPGHENYIFSFLGMAPKDDPELLMYVSVKQPKLNIEEYEMGSQPVSFIFKSVMENSLHYLNIQPDRAATEPVQTIEIPEFTSDKVGVIEEQLTQLGLVATVIGNGSTVVGVEPDTNEQVLSNQRVFILTDSPKMPDLSGWSMRNVLKLGELLDLDVSITGNGFVNQQNIEPGQTINGGESIRVDLSPPQQSNEQDIP